MHTISEKSDAQMAESVDALVSNTSRFTPVPVRPRLWVLKERNESFSFFWYVLSGVSTVDLLRLIGQNRAYWVYWAYWAYWCYWKQSNKSPFVSVAIKARAEQVYLICRAAATKRSAANLKGDLGGM